MTLEILKDIGLSDGELKVYKAVLDIGIAPVSLIHEKTGIERRNIYDILNKLIERGLISYIRENKRRVFQISHPNKLLGHIDEKKHILDDIKQKIKKEIPELTEKFQASRPNITAEIFRGIEGVKSVWEDMLNYKTNYWIGSGVESIKTGQNTFYATKNSGKDIAEFSRGRYVPKHLPYFFNNWNKRRIKLKVKWRNLLRHEMKTNIKKMKFEQIKFLPKEFSGSPTVICIFGNKVANMLLGKDYFAFVIESKQLAQNYKLYHRYLWNNVASS